MSNRTDSKSLAKAFSHLRRGRQHLADAAAIHKLALSNLDDGWIEELCNWANREDDLQASYQADGRVICHDEGLMEGRFEFPTKAEIGEPSLEAINAFWP